MIIDIISIIAGSASFAALVSFLYKKISGYFHQRQVNQNQKYSRESFINSELIYEEIVKITQEFNCNYGHLLLIHNGGKAMNELTEKNATIRMEHVTAPTARRIKHEWKNREVDSPWFKLIKWVLNDGSLHIEDLEQYSDEHEGIRLMYNVQYGKEILINKVDWIGDTLVLLIIQRDPNARMLSTKEKAYIKYRVENISKLFTGARYFLEQNRH